MSDPAVHPDGEQPAETQPSELPRLLLLFNPQTGEVSVQTNIPSKVMALGILEVGKTLVTSSKPVSPVIQPAHAIRDFLRRGKR